MLDVGAAIFSIHFFSPVASKNFLRQSLPFSYVTVSATSDVQLFSAVDDNWAGGRGNFRLSLEYTGTIRGATYMFILSDPIRNIL